MSDTTLFRTSTPPEPVTPGPDAVPNERGASMEGIVEEPLEGAAVEQAVMKSLGVDDVSGMPEEEQGKLKDATDYVLESIIKRGGIPTQGSITRALDRVKEEFGFDPAADHSRVLDRLSGIVRAWKGLSFVRDTSERRRILMRLARLPDSAKIDEELFREMERRQVWQ